MRIVRQHGPYFLLFAGGLAFGLILAAFIWKDSGSREFAIREYDQRYEFIRRLLICQTLEEEETDEFRSLQRQVNNIITVAQREHKLESASVYFRELNTGRWMGVNELETFTPASLLKVPIMMAYFKDSQDHPEILTASYAYDRRGYEEDPLVGEPLLVTGRKYTALELIRGMIIQSDNPAMSILQENTNPHTLEETYTVLDINNPYDTDEEPYQLSVKKYGLFFRVLYNGTFLSREGSNQALEMLSESEFNLGIRAGTPSNIKIAHKHGVRGSTREDGTHETEVSDCGIVYNPASPYLLCIMTRGSNAYVLSDVIKNIAEIVYQGVMLDNEGR